jgi:hypothetical protein
MMWRAPLLLLLLLAAACLAGPVPRVERAADQDQDTRRSKLATFILSLFLGRFGVDWFYRSFLCCCKISWDIFGIKDKWAKMPSPCSTAHLYYSSMKFRYAY